MIVLAQSVGQVQETLAAVQRFFPRLLAFVTVLVIGYVVARLLARAVGSVLARTGFERAVQRGGVGQVLERSGYDASTMLSKVVYFGLMLLVLQLAFAAFGPNPISASLAGIIAFLPRLFVAGVIVVLAAAIAAGARELIVAQIGSLSYGRLLGGCAYAVVLGIGVFAALDQLQIAPAIVNGLFYGLIAIIAGVTIVAVGGGGIGPMRQRWERALTRMDAESVRIRETAEHRREQRAAAEREETERQARLAREEEQRRREEVERQAAQEREAAEREEAARREREREAQEIQARRAREQQERRTTREFEALAQHGAYTEEQLRAARELEEFDRQQAGDSAYRPTQRSDGSALERLDAFNGERRRSTRETSEQRQAAWDLEKFRQEEMERQATQDFLERDLEFLQPRSQRHVADEDATGPQRSEPSVPGLDHPRRQRTARRSPSEQERPPIRYWDADSQPAERRGDAPHDEHTRPVDMERTRPVERTPWDTPDG